MYYRRPYYPGYGYPGYPYGYGYPGYPGYPGHGYPGYPYGYGYPGYFNSQLASVNQQMINFGIQTAVAQTSYLNQF